MSENYIQKYKDINQEAFELFNKKNHDYGDAFATDGIIGVLIRLGDKVQRLKHITTNSIILVNNESLRDTLLDLHNYSIMSLMLLDEKEKNTNQENILNLVKSGNHC